MRPNRKYIVLPIHLEPINYGPSFATPLTEYLRLSGSDAFVKTLRYEEMPTYFRWDTVQWSPRKKYLYFQLPYLILLMQVKTNLFKNNHNLESRI
jgi:hypothetical protein